MDNNDTQSVLGENSLGSKPQIIPISPASFKKVQLVRYLETERIR